MDAKLARERIGRWVDRSVVLAVIWVVSSNFLSEDHRRINIEDAIQHVG